MVSRDGVHSGARTASEEAPNRHREGPKTAKELERHREGPKTTMELERHREGPKTTRELETVRKTFYEYQMKKDGELKQLQEENEALKADGARKDQELTKWISHSKSQSQKVQQLKQESHVSNVHCQYLLSQTVMSIYSVVHTCVCQMSLPIVKSNFGFRNMCLSIQILVGIKYKQAETSCSMVVLFPLYVV